MFSSSSSDMQYINHHDNYVDFYIVIMILKYHFIAICNGVAIPSEKDAKNSVT